MIRKILSAILGFALGTVIATGLHLAIPDHTREQGGRQEPVPGSTTSTSIWNEGPPPSFWPTPTTTTTVAAPPPPAEEPAVEVVTPTGDVWWRLFGCETGYTYNPRIVSPSGKFRGAFQFDLQTWAGIGETGDPIDYSYEHQLAAAQRLQARRGWAPWPHCSRVLGLR